MYKPSLRLGHACANARCVGTQAKEAAEEEARKAARVLDPKAAIRAAAQETLCNAVSEFEIRIHQQLSKALDVLEQPEDQQTATQLSQQDLSNDQEACWQKFAACRAAADMRVWQHQGYSSPAMRSQ